MTPPLGSSKLTSDHAQGPTEEIPSSPFGMKATTEDDNSAANGNCDFTMQSDPQDANKRGGALASYTDNFLAKQ
jgi:hypothetical protein